MNRGVRRAQKARVKDRVRRRQLRYDLPADDVMVGRLASAPKFCTHRHCCNPRRVFGKKTRQENSHAEAHR